MTWDEVRARITGAGLAHLATVTPTGDPAVAVVSPAIDGEVLWLLTHHHSAKARNLRARPDVALMWSGNGAETYLWGDAAFVDDLATKERVWTSGLLGFDPEAFFVRPDHPDFALVRITPTRASVMAMGADGPERRTWRAA